jgi:hypothetical protein
MKRPENIIDNGEYNEPNCFESDQEAVLFYAYLEQEKYIDEITKQLTLTDVVKSLPSKEEILLQARKIENYIGEEMPIVGAEKSGKFHGFLEGVEWLSSRQK